DHRHGVVAAVRDVDRAAVRGQRHAEGCTADAPKVASERLGHSKVGITLDLYSHVLPNMQEDAVARVDAALQAAQTKPRK
ncbi:MAG: site-specific integrase, partial [Xanthobacteraceae bacterium]